MEDRIREWKASTWQILPALDMPHLDPEAVQFAVLEEDPLERYKEVLQRNREVFQEKIDEEEDPARREILRRGQMAAAWDKVFASTTGEQLYLLVPARSAKYGNLVRTVVISSSGPAGRKWLTTKIAYQAERPVCWCLPLETAIGSRVEARLGRENVLDLQSIYEQMIGDS